MAEPIRRVWMSRIKKSFFELPQEEQDEMMAKISESFKACGGKFLGGGDCSKTSSKWHWFGMEEWPNAEALQQHAKNQEDMGWRPYMEEIVAVEGVPFGEEPEG
jgi:3-deoxy-D-arabino-heptulosonate 7-phosphate (DAHP) synthase